MVGMLEMVARSNKQATVHVLYRMLTCFFECPAWGCTSGTGGCPTHTHLGTRNARNARNGSECPEWVSPSRWSETISTVVTIFGSGRCTSAPVAAADSPTAVGTRNVGIVGTRNARNARNAPNAQNGAGGAQVHRWLPRTPTARNTECSECSECSECPEWLGWWCTRCNRPQCCAQCTELSMVKAGNC